MRRFRILIAICLICMMILSGSAAHATLLDQALGLLMADKDFSASLTVRMTSYPSLDEVRLTQLNRLLEGIAFRGQRCGEETEASIRIGEEEPLIIRWRQETAGTAFQISAMPGITLIRKDGEGFEADPLNGLADVSGIERAASYWQLLEEGVQFLTDLPDYCPEEAREQKVRQKLRTGVAVRSVTVRLTADQVKTGRMTELIQSMPASHFRDALAGCTFTGKQQFTMLYDEENRLLKSQYSGRAGTDPDHLRNVRLEWRGIHAEERRVDDLTFKTPAVDGSERDNWTLTREWARSEEESFRMTVSYDRKGPEGKRSLSGEAQLTAGETLTGEISWKVTLGRETESWRLHPTVSSVTADGMEGEVTFSHLENKTLMEEMTFGFRIDRGAESSWQPDTEELMMTRETAVSLRDRCSAVLLRGLLSLPEENLLFLSDGIPAADWQQIVNER